MYSPPRRLYCLGRPRTAFSSGTQPPPPEGPRGTDRGDAVQACARPPTTRYPDPPNSDSQPAVPTTGSAAHSRRSLPGKGGYRLGTGSHSFWPPAQRPGKLGLPGHWVLAADLGPSPCAAPEQTQVQGGGGICPHLLPPPTAAATETQLGKHRPRGCESTQTGASLCPLSTALLTGKPFRCSSGNLASPSLSTQDGREEWAPGWGSHGVPAPTAKDEPRKV